MANQEKPRRTKKRLGSYPAVSVVFSIFLALFIIGLFGMLLIHSQRLTGIIKENIELQVYLDKNISDVQVTQIQKRIATESYVLNASDVESVVFVSREEAASEFTEQTGEDFSSFLGDNPLRDLLRIRVSPEYQFTDSLQNVAASIEGISGVYEVVYVENLVDSINSNITKISFVLLAFAGLLTLIVILLINNTIKLALFSQRFLIRSMQLVGANASFIRRPFLSRAASYGFIAAVIACGALVGVQQYAYNQVAELSALSNQQYELMLFGLIVAIGITLATASTFKAISKYLKMSLDELY